MSPKSLTRESTKLVDAASTRAAHDKALRQVRQALSSPKPASVRKSAAANAKGATVVKSRTVFEGRVFSVTTDTVTEPGGVTSTRDVIRHRGSVIILAVDASADPADPTILLERQYRHAAGKFLLELPAGRIEPGEAALAAAKRELIEETGFRARRWSRLVRYFASPGFLTEFMQVFLAEEIRPGVARPEPDEKITLHPTPLSEVLRMIEAGAIEDGKTILATLLYARRVGSRL